MEHEKPQSLPKGKGFNLLSFSPKLLKLCGHMGKPWSKPRRREKQQGLGRVPRRHRQQVSDEGRERRSGCHKKAATGTNSPEHLAAGLCPANPLWQKESHTRFASCVDFASVSSWWHGVIVRIERLIKECTQKVSAFILGWVVMAKSKPQLPRELASPSSHPP